MGSPAPRASSSPLLVSGPPLLIVVGTERLVERVTEDLRTLAQETGAAGAVSPSPRPAPRPSAGCRAIRRPRCGGRRPCTRPCAGV
jgi:hypothetical protein